MGARVLVWC